MRRNEPLPGHGTPGAQRSARHQGSGVNSGAPTRMLHFGKLPSRGDFVRSAHAPSLIQTLDQWLTGGIEALAASPRWKLLYDRCPPLHFAFLGTRSNKGLAGHLIATHDTSGRRYPFITAALLEADEPLAYLARSPVVLAQPWQQLEASAAQACASPDAAPLLAGMGQQMLEVASSAAAGDAGFRDFLEAHTVGSLEALLVQAGHKVELRTLILGVGLLLQPVPASGAQRLDKGLLLPLPQDPLLRPLVASLWLEMIAGFLKRAAFELALFLPQRVATPGTAGMPAAPGQPGTAWGSSGPVLAVGFDGPASRTLHGLFDPEMATQVFIDATAAEWVEEFVQQDYGMAKLSTYLSQPALSLRQAVDTFKETFLGS